MRAVLFVASLGVLWLLLIGDAPRTLFTGGARSPARVRYAAVSAAPPALADPSFTPLNRAAPADGGRSGAVLMVAFLGGLAAGAMQQRAAKARAKFGRSSRLRMGEAEPVGRRAVLQWGALLGLPLPARADVFGDLGVSRKDLGLPEPPPPPPLDPRQAAEQKKQAEAAARAAKKAEADAARAEKDAALKRAKDEKAAAEKAKEEEKAREKAKKKELEELGLSPSALGLDGKPPKRTKPLTEKEKKQQKKRNEEAKKKRAEKKNAAKQAEAAAKRDAENAKKELDKTKASLDFYQSEIATKKAAYERKEAEYQRALKKERSI